MLGISSKEMVESSLTSIMMEGLENSGFSAKELSAQRLKLEFLYDTSNASQLLFSQRKGNQKLSPFWWEKWTLKFQENLELECLHKGSSMGKDNQP